MGILPRNVFLGRTAVNPAAPKGGIMSRESLGRRSLGITALALVVTAMGCSSTTKNPGNGADGGTAQASDAGGGGGGDTGTTTQAITVKIAQNSWLGSQINSLIAKILLEEQLKVKVDIIDADESGQWD